MMVMDDIAGMSHADSLGSLVSYWRYSGKQQIWALDHKQLYVLIE
ncbi:MAG: hypothetical protein N3I35_15960 [Clostridia bacterium]|nr:hypothetical protein [Clostridia bacterium]